MVLSTAAPSDAGGLLDKQATCIVNGPRGLEQYVDAFRSYVNPEHAVEVKTCGERVGLAEHQRQFERAGHPFGQAEVVCLAGAPVCLKAQAGRLHTGRPSDARRLAPPPAGLSEGAQLPAPMMASEVVRITAIMVPPPPPTQLRVASSSQQPAAAAADTPAGANGVCGTSQEAGADAAGEGGPAEEEGSTLCGGGRPAGRV
ncbi:MAG: hypothetical protein WDW36_006934 [Sanguina aurantia]